MTVAVNLASPGPPRKTSTQDVTEVVNGTRFDLENNPQTLMGRTLIFPRRANSEITAPSISPTLSAQIHLWAHAGPTTLWRRRNVGNELEGLPPSACLRRPQPSALPNRRSISDAPNSGTHMRQLLSRLVATCQLLDSPRAALMSSGAPKEGRSFSCFTQRRSSSRFEPEPTRCSILLVFYFS